MREPSELELLQQVIFKAQEDTPAPLPGRVQKYSKITGMVDVELGTWGEKKLPMCIAPWKHFRVGNMRIVVEPKAGDECTVLFYKHDPSKYWATATPTQGIFTQAFGTYWPVAIPGRETLLSLMPDMLAPTFEGLHIGTDDGLCEAVFTAGGIKLGVALGDLIPLAQPVLVGDAFDLWFTGVQTAVAAAFVTASGAITAQGPTPLTGATLGPIITALGTAVAAALTAPGPLIQSSTVSARGPI